jgi:perosamine synthetase
MAATPRAVPISLPSFGPAEMDAALRPLRSGWVAQGPEVNAFERALAHTTASPHALSCTSGTAALHLALAAIGIKPGDEVVVPAFTWVATANVVELLGARAVLCDVNPRTFCSDPEHFEAALSPRTRALLPVHLFGHVAPMHDLLDLARQHHLHVVEDAACALGSSLDGQHAGTFGDVGAFSFHPRKIITAGEGGALTTHNDTIAAQLASLRNHGAGGPLLPSYHEADYQHLGHNAWHSAHPGAAAYVMADFIQPGFNYRIGDIQGAILLAQLLRLDDLLARRRALAARYDAALGDLPIDLPLLPHNMQHSYQSYTIRLLPDAPTSRDDLADLLATHGIQTRQGTHAVHLLGAYRDRYQPHDLPGALEAHQRSLALPLYPDLSFDDQDYVIEHLRNALA